MTYQPDVATLWKIKSADDRMALAEEFLNAHTEAQYQALRGKYPLVFGLRSRGQEAEDIKAVCELMRNAYELYALCHSDEPFDAADLWECSVSFSPSGVGDADAPAQEIEMDKYHLSFYKRMPGRHYGEWLAYASGKINDRFPGFRLGMRYEGGTLIYQEGMHSLAEWNDAKAQCEDILRQIINLHLVDVATICEEKTLCPVQMAYSGISAIWLGLVERMCYGRAFRCKACGKPDIAYGERRKREFCTEACRKWASANPSKKRDHWYYQY